MRFILAWLLTGCSFFVHSPRYQLGQPHSCSAPRTTAIIDTSTAAVSAGAAAFLYHAAVTYQPRSCPANDDSCADYSGLGYFYLALIATGVSMLYTTSAADGWVKVSACTGDIAPDDRPGYAAWLNRTYANREPPVRFDAAGPDGTTLVVSSPACDTAELNGFLQGAFLETTVTRGFTKVTCAPSWMPAPTLR